MHSRHALPGTQYERHKSHSSVVWNALIVVWMGLLTDAYNCELRMCWECRESFPPPQRFSDPDMHHCTCVTQMPWCMPGSLTSGFLWSPWPRKRSRHSRRKRNQRFCASGKRLMASTKVLGFEHWQLNSNSNLLWPSDAIRRQRSWSTLAQVTTCRMMEPSCHLDQCWLNINGVLWHSQTNFTRSSQDIKWETDFKIHWKLFCHLSGANQLNETNENDRGTYW